MTNTPANLIRPDLSTLLDILADYQIAEAAQLEAALMEIELYAPYSGQYGQNRKAEALAGLKSIREDLALTFAMRDYVINSRAWDDLAVPLVNIGGTAVMNPFIGDAEAENNLF